jgi:S1-C subfamily serine protease
MAVGYPQEPGVIAYQMVASRGVIQEVHPRRRDSVMSTFPSFQTTALYKPGMSGGPIIDTKCRVVGVVAHGTESDDPRLVTGYGASIAGLVEFKIDLHNDDGVLQEFTFDELTKAGALQVGGHYVTLVRDEGGVTLDWRPGRDEAVDL